MTDTKTASVTVAGDPQDGKGGILSRINVRSVLPLLGFLLILGFFAVATGVPSFIPRT